MGEDQGFRSNNKTPSAGIHESITRPTPMVQEGDGSSHLQSKRLECVWYVGGWREDIWGAFPPKDGI